MIDIKVIVNGQQSNIVPKVYDSAQLQDNLEHSGGISLSWKSKTDGEIPIGSYVTYNGLRYILLDPYAPSKEGGPKNTRACYYKYDVQFKHPQGLLDKTPLWFDSRDAYGNPIELRTTSYTGYPYVIVKKVVDFMAEYANKMNDDFFAEAVGLTKDGNNKWQSTWTFNITAQVDQYGIPTNKSAIITVGFDGSSIKGAIDSIADAMGCNVYWDWANKEIIFVAGTTIDGESFNCFHVLGGTTNMGKATVSGGFAAVTQRLTLNETLYPGSIIDMRPNHSGIRLTKELILDNIYPKMDLYISYVHERTCRLTDEEGDFIVDHFEKDGAIVTPETEGAKPVYKTFAKWYVKLAYDKAGTQPYTFNQALLIDDKPLSLLFQLDYKNPNSMSKLVGRQFELTFFPEAKTEWDKTDVVDHDHAYEAPAGSFRVAFVAEGEIILPTTSAGGLCPQIGDKVTLVNMALTSDMINNAKSELLAAAREIIGLMQTPKGEYSETVIFGDEDPTTHEVPAPRIPRLMVGDATPFGNEHGPIVSAINLNLDTDVADVTVSSWTRKTRSGGTADKVETVTVSANSSTQGGNNYSNGSIGDGSYGGGSDSQTTYNNATLKPDSLFIASLNNVVDSISCDANGKVKQNTDIITKITCNYGTKDITSVCNLSYTEDWPYTVDGEETKRITAFLEDTPVYEEGVTHSTPLTVPNRTYDLSETKRYIRINFPQGFDMAHFDGKLPFAFTIGHPYFTDRAVGITVEALVPGVSSYKSTMFVRMDNTPTKPADDKGSYAVPSPTDCLAGQNSDGQNVYWSDGIPAGENKLWATTRIFSNTGVSPQQSSWSDPRQMTDTDTYDVEFAKMQTNDAKPADPTDANRHGGSGTQIWFDTTLDSSEDFTKMYWRAEREKKNGVWGAWTIIRIKGEKGDTPENLVSCYRWYLDGITPAAPTTRTEEPTPAEYATDTTKAYPASKWSKNAPNRQAEGWNLWMSQTTKHVAMDGTVTYDAWNAPVRISGDTGSPGADGSDIEWIYKFDTSGYNGNTGQVNPTGAASGGDTNKQQNGWVPNGWYNHAQAVSKDSPTLYASFRRKDAGNNQQWGAFQNPITWSHWGRNGMDGDGVEYVYMRTKKNIAPELDHTQSGYASDEFRPTIINKSTCEAEFTTCTDDLTGISEEYQYEWVISRTMTDPDVDSGQRSWQKFTGKNNDFKMSLSNHFGESAFVIDLDNNNDQFGTDSTSKVLVEQKRRTTASLYYGSQEQTLTNLTATLQYEDGTSVATGVASVTATKATGVVEVTIKANNTISSHNEIIATITAMCARGSKTITFPIQKVMSGAPGENPIIYNVAATQRSFSFYRDSNNALAPDSRSSKINVLKTEGNTTTTISTATSGLTFRWGWDDSATAQASNQAIGTTLTVTKAQAADHSSIWVELSTGDRETLPIVKDGENGSNGDEPMQAFQWNQSPTSAPTPLPKGAALGSWSLTAPNRPTGTGDYYLWMTHTTKHTDKQNNVTYDTWSAAVRISGDKGTAGEDGTDYEYIYILKTAQYTFPNAEKPANITTDTSGTQRTPEYIAAHDDFIPQGWSDNPQGISNTNKFEYMSLRVKPKGSTTWGAFSDPIIWSHWGRNGMDGDGVEYVFARTISATAPSVANNNAHDGTKYTDDDFLPAVSGAKTMSGSSIADQTYATDNPQGVSRELPYEWVAKRTMDAPNGDTGARTWKGYTIGAMQLWSKWSEDGATPEMRYQWNQDAQNPPTYSASSQNPGSSWKTNVPNRPGNGYFLWAITALHFADGTYGTWGNPIRLTGDTGTPGEDGDEREWIYSYSNTGYDGNTGHIGGEGTGTDTNKQQADWIPNGWRDNPKGVDQTNTVEYASYRDVTNNGTTKTYGAFQTPILWSHYGRNGIDGDGVEYVFIRTKKNIAPVIDNEGTSYTADEWRPYISNGSTCDAEKHDNQYRTTDDPTGVNKTYPFEWVAKRTMGNADATGKRSWKSYRECIGSPYEMSLWAKYNLENEIPAALFKWEADGTSATKPSVTAANYMAGTNLGGWSKNAPNRNAEGYNLWMTQNTVVTAADGTYSFKDNADWSTPIRISGDKGTPGEDADEREWVYKLSDTNPGTPPSSGNGAISPNGVANGNTAYVDTLDDWVPNTWSDNPQGVTDEAGKRTEWASWRDFNKTTGKWGAFNASIRWSHYGERGIDGDGVEYVFARSKGENYVPTVSQTQTQISEYYPTIGNYDTGKYSGSTNGTSSTEGSKWTDDPTGVTDTWPIEWVIMRRKIGGTWGEFNTVAAIWSKWSEDGRDIGENLIDNSEPPHSVDVTTLTPDGRTDLYGNVKSYGYVTDKTYEPGKMPASGTVVSAQARITISGATFASDATMGDGTSLANKGRVALEIDNGSQWFTLFGRIEFTSNGTKECKLDGWTLNYNESLNWSGSVRVRADNFLTGTITVERVKLEVGPKCTAWCLSENDKYSKRIDLDNQSDAVAVDSNGNARFARTITTRARIYNGAKPVTTGVTNTTSNSLVIGGCTPSVNLSNGVLTVTWAFTKGMAATSAQKIIKLTYGGNEYSAVFSLITQDTQAVYQLLPSRDSIDFVRQSDNTLSPSHIQVWCGYKKLTGSGVETHPLQYNISASECYNFDNSGYALWVRHIDANGNPYVWDSSVSPYGWMWMTANSSNERDIYNNTTLSAIQFCIGPANESRTQWSDADIIDLETIPIVKDGANGSSAWIADLDNEMDSVSCDDGGYPKKQQSVKTNLSFFYGSSKQSFKVTSIVRKYGTNNGSTTTYSSNSTINGVTVNLFASFNTPSQTNLLTVAYATSALITGKDIFTITMKDSNGSNPRDLNFIVNGVNGDVYNLMPWDDQISAKYDGTNYKVNGSTSFPLNCGYTKNIDGTITTVKDVTDGRVEGKYNIFYRKRRRSDKKWENWDGSRTTYDDTGTFYPMYYRLINGSTSVDINTCDAFEIVLTPLGSEQTGGFAIDDIQAIDHETVYVISDGADGRDGADVGENIIDGTGVTNIISSFEGSGANNISRWYNGMFTLNDVELKANTPYSCQMRVKLEGCGNLNGRNFRLHLSTKNNNYPFICEFNPTENGTYELKKENFTFSESYANAGFYSGVTFGWARSDSNEITLGTITIDKVKLEAGEKCTAWSLSENDKKGDVWTIGQDGYWYKNGVKYIDADHPNGIKAEGKDGTGVEIKGSVANFASLPTTGVSIGDCWITEDDRHLWTCTGVNPITWKDLGVFKGDPGANSYMHIAYADSIVLSSGVVQSCSGFTVVKNKDAYDWLGLCTDNNPLDPGASGRDAGSDLANARFYEWNYVKGSNSIRLALDNEHEDFLYNLNGLVAPENGAKSPIHLYDGNNEVTLQTSALSVDSTRTYGVPSSGYYAPSIISENGVNKLYVPKLEGSEAKVTVKTSYLGQYYYAEFTANKTESDKYDIIVKPNAIAFNASETWTTDKTITVVSEGIDNQGNKLSPTISTSSSTSQGNFYIFYGYVKANGRVYNPDSPTTEGTKNLRGTSFTLTQNIANTYYGVYFELRYYTSSSDYRLCDYETVEIAKTENPVTYEIVFTEAWARKDKDNHVTGRLKGNAYKIEGATRTALANATIRYGYTGGIYGDTTTNSNGYFDDQNYFDDSWDDTSTCNYAKSIYASIRINSDAVCTEYINISFDGSQGQRGATGRMYFMQGKWDANTTYRRTTERVPLIFYSNGNDWNTALECYGHYYYLNADSSYNQTPGAQGSPWVLCDEFAIVISRGIFAEFAKLGSFVISGDWMISQTAVSGSPSSDYTHFNPYFPNSQESGTNAKFNGNNFIPVYAVDGLTGKVYMNDAEVAGTINASTIKGTVVVGDNTKAYMEIVPTTEGTDEHGQVYRTDIVGKANGFVANPLEIGIYRLKDSTRMGGHFTLRDTSSGDNPQTFGISHIDTSGFYVTDGDNPDSPNYHESFMNPQTVFTYHVITIDISAEGDVSAGGSVITPQIKGNNGAASAPVAFPYNVDPNETVVLPSSFLHGVVVFAPNCLTVKTSATVYASDSNTAYSDASTGHTFNSKVARLFVGWKVGGTCYWKEYDCR